MTIRWPSRIAAFLLWALAALSATVWLLKVIGSAETPVTAGTISAELPTVEVHDLARALGPDEPIAAVSAPLQQAQSPDARMRLLGVVAGRRSGGVALIAIEGQPPRPYRVGSQVGSGYTLTQVAARTATLTPTQPDSQSFTLELPTTLPAPTQPQTPVAAPGAGRSPGVAQFLPKPVVPAATPEPDPAVIPPSAGTEDMPKD